MEVKDFRVGNLVEYFYPHEEEWDKLELSLSDLPDIDNESFRPIPLTEKLLLKFGFKKEKEGFTKARFCIYQPVGYVNFMFCEGNSILREVKYVHTLQNLYHALTGEELTIKELL